MSDDINNTPDEMPEDEKRYAQKFERLSELIEAYDWPKEFLAAYKYSNFGGDSNELERKISIFRFNFKDARFTKQEDFPFSILTLLLLRTQELNKLSSNPSDILIEISINSEVFELEDEPKRYWPLEYVAGHISKLIEKCIKQVDCELIEKTTGQNLVDSENLEELARLISDNISSIHHHNFKVEEQLITTELFQAVKTQIVPRNPFDVRNIPEAITIFFKLRLR